ncbi:MAG: chemotaxis protein CheW [Pseudomonadota bacterium]
MSTDPSRNTGLQQPGAMTILTFRLMGEIFALAVERVHEIIDPLPVTLVPRTDPFVPGLINVRGSVVPVADLRQRLDMPPAEATEHSRMVVLDVLIEDTPTKVALVADSVDQVSEVDGSRIEPVPEIGMRFPPRFLAGVAKRDGELIILLRVETVFEPPQGRQPHAA